MSDFELRMTRGKERVVLITFDTAINPSDKVWFTAKESYDDAYADAIVALSTDASTLTIESSGTLAFGTISPAMTSGLPGYEVRLPADVQIDQSGGTLHPKAVQRGHLTVQPNVT